MRFPLSATFAAARRYWLFILGQSHGAANDRFQVSGDIFATVALRRQYRCSPKLATATTAQGQNAQSAASDTATLTAAATSTVLKKNDTTE